MEKSALDYFPLQTCCTSAAALTVMSTN